MPFAAVTRLAYYVLDEQRIEERAQLRADDDGMPRPRPPPPDMRRYLASPQTLWYLPDFARAVRFYRRRDPTATAEEIHAIMERVVDRAWDELLPHEWLLDSCFCRWCGVSTEAVVDGIVIDKCALRPR